MPGSVRKPNLPSLGKIWNYRNIFLNFIKFVLLPYFKPPKSPLSGDFKTKYVSPINAIVGETEMLGLTRTDYIAVEISKSSTMPQQVSL